MRTGKQFKQASLRILRQPRRLAETPAIACSFALQLATFEQNRRQPVTACKAKQVVSDTTRPKAMMTITKALGSRLAEVASSIEELSLSSQVVTMQVIVRIIRDLD